MNVLAAGARGGKPPPARVVPRRQVRKHKGRRVVSKLMPEHEAIDRFVEDGDYVSYDCNLWNRGPASLMREIIRQRKRNLWIAAKFTAHDAPLLVAAGCASRL